MFEMTDNTYKVELAIGKPVLLSFWAPWCRPCGTIAPVIAGLVFWKLGSQWPYYGSALIMIAPLLLSSRLPTPSDATPTSAG